MSNDEHQRYIVSVIGGDKSLTELNELTNSFTGSGFELTFTDKDGKIYELGPCTFSLTTSLDQQEVEKLALGLSESALSAEPQIEVLTVDEWLKEKESNASGE